MFELWQPPPPRKEPPMNKRRRLAQERARTQRNKRARREHRKHQRAMQLDTATMTCVRYAFLYLNIPHCLTRWNSSADRTVYAWQYAVAAKHPYLKKLVKRGTMRPDGRPSNAIPRFYRSPKETN